MIWQLFEILLMSSGRWQTILYCDMLSSPDTLQVLLSGIISMTWSLASLESTVLGFSTLPDCLSSCNPNKISWTVESTASLPFTQEMFLVSYAVFELVKHKYVKLTTVVECDQQTPFSIATTPRCREGHYSFPWIAPLYSWYVPYIAEC